MTRDARPSDRGIWPDERDEQVPVMLLGTYHMDNPGLDVANIEADDVLTAARQDQLSTLVDHLARWEPDLVVVERPYGRAERVNQLYREYRNGDREYDREERIDPPHPERDDPTAECRSEVIQVGFRLADRLNHDRVAPVDWPTTLANDDLAALKDRGFKPPEKLDATGVDPRTFQAEVNERIAENTVIEALRWLNREAQLRRFNGANMDGLLWMGEGENYGGPRALGTWYERNLRMIHNLWRAPLVTASQPAPVSGLSPSGDNLKLYPRQRESHTYSCSLTPRMTDTE